MKTIVAMVFMVFVGAAIVSLMAKLPDNRWFNVLRLAAIVPSSAAAYLLAVKLLRSEMLSLLLGGGRSNSESANGSIED
ncbi:MAG: hypothetical protein ACYSYL_19805 [Planctomycetota bacterium]